MSAAYFETLSEGKTLKQAFDAATSKAKMLYGAGGYTGTVAEKRTVVEITEYKGRAESTARTFARKLIADDDSRVDDKWGPAGAICYSKSKGKWLIFGWASS